MYGVTIEALLQAFILASRYVIEAALCRHTHMGGRYDGPGCWSGTEISVNDMPRCQKYVKNITQ